MLFSAIVRVQIQRDWFQATRDLSVHVDIAEGFDPYQMAGSKAWDAIKSLSAGLPSIQGHDVS